MLDHQKITDEQIIDRYVMNRLSPEEREAFEDYFMNNPEVLDELELAEAFQRDLSKVAVEDTAEAVVKVSVLNQ